MGSVYHWFFFLSSFFSCSSGCMGSGGSLHVFFSLGGYYYGIKLAGWLKSARTCPNYSFSSFLFLYTITFYNHTPIFLYILE